MPKKTAILGFGNPVRSDDGVGCFVIEQLRRRFDPLPDWMTLLDMGTSAFETLFQLQGHERIILIDAVINSGEPDGTLFCLPATEAMSAVQEDPMVFLHSLKWDQALSYAQKIMGEAFPDDIRVYLVAVSDLRLEVGLSDPIRAAGNRVSDLIWEHSTAPAV
ncbi:MAG: hydrogenase maturation protease [Saprospiraceae bacterium]|nr:hydrogenase maturation protease [Saprospiraceae bacterium]